MTNKVNWIKKRQLCVKKVNLFCETRLPEDRCSPKRNPLISQNLPWSVETVGRTEKENMLRHSKLFSSLFHWCQLKIDWSWSFSTILFANRLIIEITKNRKVYWSFSAIFFVIFFAFRLTKTHSKKLISHSKLSSS